MKRISTLLIALLLTTPALFADDISLDKARKAAEIFLTQGSAITRGSSCKLTLVNASEVAATRSGAKPAYYIFNREGGGFVIISAIDAAKPVLGYSFENTFGPIDEMPENLVEWLDEYRYQIGERRASGEATTAEEAARWDALMSAARTAVSQGGVKDLKTPDWGQGDPWNRKCPLDSNGKRTIVGCTNTAISELMFYHKYPKAGKGTLPGYTKKGITVPSITLGEEYQWDKMLSKYSSGSYTSEQADAAATLCYHVAVMSQASFGSGATSASTTSATPRMTTYFGYDKGFTTYSSSLFSYDEWRALLKECIDKDLPVLYTGYSNSGGGHAFLIDGYDDAGRMLINFGWSASSNGYYEIGSFGKYVRTNRCWVNVRPDAGGKDTGYMSLTSGSSSNHRGLNYVSGIPTSGGSISIYFGAICWNSNSSEFTGELNLKLLSKDGVDKGWVRAEFSPSTPITSGNKRSWTNPMTLTIPSNVTIERGDYIAAFYKEDGSSEWKMIRYPDSEVSIFGKIYCHIADFTSMEFNASTRKLIFTTFAGATYTLTNASGSAVSNGVSYSNGVLTIDTNQLPKGKYTVTFTAGGMSTTVSFII